MKHRILYIFTRTPLHVGAGASVGAIDQPIQRERHTGFPIIPATSLKGSFADQWPTTLRNEKGEIVRIVDSEKAKDKTRSDDVAVVTTERIENGAKKEAEFLAHISAWLFGSDITEISFAGSLVFSEARVLAFPIRSAKGSFGWITSPLMLKRAAHDGVFGKSQKNENGKETNNLLVEIEKFTELTDDRAVFMEDGPLALGEKVVLEDYCFSCVGTYPADVAAALADLTSDPLFDAIKERLVILSNGMMSYFATSACEVAQHVRISDETGTADEGGLFNQENVPSETLFYAVLRAADSRAPNGTFQKRKSTDALDVFARKVDGETFQFGGNATTGLGFCSAYVRPKANGAKSTEPIAHQA